MISKIGLFGRRFFSSLLKPMYQGKEVVVMRNGEGLPLFFEEANKKNVKINLENILQKLTTFLEKEVKPYELKIDQDSNKLQEVFRKFAQEEFFKIRVPKGKGGYDLALPEYLVFKETMAKYSTALTFLQTQMQTSVELVLSSKINELLKKTYLSKMATGQETIGMALSQLANHKNPAFIGKKVKGGYLIEKGMIHFATGWNIFDKLVIGFVAKNDKGEMEEITAIVPFKNFSKNNGELIYSEPMKLNIATSTNTVSLTLEHWFISDADVITVNPLQTFYNRSVNYTNLDSYMAGVMSRLLSLVDVQMFKQKRTSIETEGYHYLQKQLKQYEELITNRKKGEPVALTRALGSELFDQCYTFVLQILKDQNEALNRLQDSRALYMTVTSYENLLKATVERQEQNPAIPADLPTPLASNTAFPNQVDMADLIKNLLTLVDSGKAKAPDEFWSKGYQNLQKQFERYHEVIKNNDNTRSMWMMWMGNQLFDQCHNFALQTFRGRLLLKDNEIGKKLKQLQDKRTDLLIKAPENFLAMLVELQKQHPVIDDGAPHLSKKPKLG